jgi:hypothetical protein
MSAFFEGTIRELNYLAFTPALREGKLGGVKVAEEGREEIESITE